MLGASALRGTKYFSNIHFACRRKYIYVRLDKKFEIGRYVIVDVKEREIAKFDRGWERVRKSGKGCN